MMGGDLSYNNLNFLGTTYPNVVTSSGSYGLDRDEFQFYNPEGSAFAQDRWEYEGMVLNAGLRYDAFSVGDQISSAEVTDRVKTQWSPRVGIAYPISDRDVMSFHYGRLFQVPDRAYIYQGRNISSTARGNPNLEPQTTISYQLGVQHLFSREVYGQFGVYFKDIFGLLTTVDQTVPGYAITVPTYVNGDYASSRGIEVTLIKRHSHGFSGELNYTSRTPRGRPPIRTGRSRPRETSATSTSRPPSSRSTGTSATASRRRCGSEIRRTGPPRSSTRSGPASVHAAGARVPPARSLAHELGAAAEHVGAVVPGGEVLPHLGQSMTLYVQRRTCSTEQHRQPAAFALAVRYDLRGFLPGLLQRDRAGGRAFLIQDQNGDGQEDWYP